MYDIPYVAGDDEITFDPDEIIENIEQVRFSCVVQKVSRLVRCPD